LKSGQLNPDSVSHDAYELSSRSFLALYEACPFPVLKVDHGWTVEHMNPAALNVLFKKPPPDGVSYWSLFADILPSNSEWKSHHYLALEDNRPPPEFVQFFAAPVNLWMAVTIRPVSNGMFIFFRDVTAERRCAEAAVKNERLATLGRLSSSIVHEILNPLESVTNLLYLANQTEEIAAVKAYLQIAEQEVERASSIVSQTLRFNRKSAEPAVISCDVLLNEILSLQKTQFSRAHIKLEIRATRALQVRCNEGEIRQIVANLITNSIDAMSPKGGRLLVRAGRSTRRQGRGVVITVADTGIGMSNEVRSKIFDPFFTTEKEQGNGLGLWISRELAQKHGGTLKAKSSQHNGRSGSVFQLYLPAGF
jgi:signal transduction histidine kinase